MKYIFFGTPRFAEIVLDDLIRALMPPVALICNPDRPVGRKKIITPPPTKQLALASTPDIAILQPEKIDDALLQRVAAFKPDFFVVAAYAKILPKTLLNIPRLGTLGTHPSLLPKFRGASPIQSAILAGEIPTHEIRTGATIYLMDEKTDHGPILAKSAITVAPANYLIIEEKLAKLSGKLLIETIPKFLEGTMAPRIQNEPEATYTKKFSAEDGFIKPDDLALATTIKGSATHGNDRENIERATEILRKMYALNPEPGTWTLSNGKRVKLLEGTIANDRLVLTLIQRDGEKPKRGEFRKL